MGNEERREITRHALRITFWWLAVAAIAAWLLWMTLRPQEQASSDLTYITAPAAARGISIPFLIGFLGNIAVFVPLSAAVVFALANKPRGIRLLAATAVGAGLSAAIELLQRMIPSRFSGFDDWLLNTLGTFIGAIVATILIRRRDRHR